MKYLSFIRIGIKEATAYRLNAAMAFMNGVLYLILATAIWTAIDAAGTLTGSLTGVLTYIVLGQVVSRSVFVSVENVLGDKIREGTIANELKRPIALRGQVYFQLLGKAVFNAVSIGVPMGVLGAVFIGLPVPSLLQFGAFFLGLFLAFNLVFALSFATSMLIFWTKVDWSIRQMRHTVQELFSGVLFPLYLLPAWLADVFNLLPFKYMVDVPIEIYRTTLTGPELLHALGMQLVWFVVLLALGEVMWRRAKTKLTVQGG